MTFPQIFVLLVLLIPLTLVFMGRLREDVAALLMAALLGLAQFFGMGVLGPAQTPAAAAKALTGFGTPEVITLLSLFILTYCLDKYGVTRGIASRLLKIGGRSERRLIGLFAVTAALLSMFMNTLAAGALLLPSALDASRRTGVKPSKLLIPIAYGTMLGGAMLYMTARDYARFGELLRNNGRVNGHQLLSARWVEFMKTPSPHNAGYGGHLWLNHEGAMNPLFPGRGSSRIFAAVGHHGQYLVIDPTRRLVILRIGVSVDEQYNGVRRALVRLIELFPQG